MINNLLSLQLIRLYQNNKNANFVTDTVVFVPCYVCTDRTFFNGIFAKKKKHIIKESL